MRDALSLSDQAIAYGAGTLTEGAVRQMLGAVDRDHAVRIVEALAASDGAALVAAADALRGLGLSAAGTLEELAALLQQMALAQVVPEALDRSDPDTPQAVRLAAALDADEIQLHYSIVLQARAELALAPDEYSGLVMVLLRMLAFRPQGAGQGVARPPPAAVATAPKPARAAAAAAAASISAAVPARVASRPTLEPPPWLDAPFEDTEDTTPPPVEGFARMSAPIAAASDTLADAPAALGTRWHALVVGLNEAGRISAFARELAMQAQCIAFDEQATPVICRLRVERETLRAAAPCEKLQAALAETLGREVRLEVEAGPAGDSAAKREAAERARLQSQAEKIIHDDPLVQALMAQYKTARIVPGSVKPH
jgi:DNA polymerase-3 subunit gamma/tau